MSSVQTYLIQDDRLLVTDQVRYAVLKGAANNTTVQYQAISGVNAAAAQTVAGIGTNLPSSLTWNVQIPSQEIVVARDAAVRYTVRAVVTKTNNSVNAAVAEPVWNAANNALVNGANTLGADSLNAFPVSQCIQTIQCTINNATVSMNVQDTINALLRFHDSRDLAEYQGLAPYLVDRSGLYTAAAAGATGFGASANTAVLDEAFTPRSAFPVRVIQGGGALNTVAGLGATASCIIEFDTYEPLWVSPWTWCNPKVGGQGMYGIQNLSIVMNMGNYQRMIRSLPQYITASGVAATSMAVTGLFFTNAQLVLNYLTPQPSSVMIPRNVVPYYEVPRYFLTSGTDVAAADVAANTRFLARKSATGIVSSNNLQLNQIPDKLILFFEPLSISGQTDAGVATSVALPYYNRANCPEFYATIDSLSINFNNQSGLLSTWTQRDLYHASRDAGSKQSWYEFIGEMESSTPTIIDGQSAGFQYAGAAIGNDAAAGAQSGGLNLPMTGSVCVLQFGKDIELPDYYASGSIGNFNLQINASISHVQPFPVTYRLVAITVNSGVFVNEKGTSNPYTALLRKEDVLNASSMEPIGLSEFNRMVGGGFLDKLKSVGSSIWSVAKPVLKFLAPSAKAALAASSNPYAQMASKAVDPAMKLMGDGMGAGGRLMKHARGSGYAY